MKRCSLPAAATTALAMATWAVGHTDRFRAAMVGAPVSNQVSSFGTSDIPMFDVMEIAEELRELILVGASALELRRKAIEEGMITLRNSGLRKVKDGLTTIDEVVRETVK